MQYPTNPYKIKKNYYITHLYCSTCKRWITVNKTSLFTGEKYVIQNLQYPSIIDNDVPYIKIIFQGLNTKALKKICKNYNNISNYNNTQSHFDYVKYIDSPHKL